MKRWRHGEVNPETGLVFVGYYKTCKNGEWWLKRERFDARMKRRAERHRQRYSSDEKLREKLRARCRAWQKTDFGRQYDSARKSKPENLEKRRAKERLKKECSPIYRASLRIRHKLTKVMCARRLSRSKTISKAIGLPWPLLEKFISDQFSSGMNWDNIGEWHIDHFIPMKAAKTARQLETLSHYSNLRPLWAKENLKKGDRMPSIQEVISRNNFLDEWNKNNIHAAQMGGMQTQGIQQ